MLKQNISFGFGQMKLAICFFGLMRSLLYTKDSIRSHIFDVLSELDVEYDVFVHTFNQTSIFNPRSQEFDVTLRLHDWRFLHPSKIILEDPSAYIEPHVATLLPLLLSHGDPWGEGPPHTSLGNLIKQLHSLQQVTSLWLNASSKYDVVIYCRPDVLFFNDLNISLVQKATKSHNTIYVPSFHSWSGYNDRFAFGSPQVMHHYGNRGSHLLNFSLISRPHSEAFLRYALERVGINVQYTDILFERVRSTGALWVVPVNGTIASRKNYQIVKNAYGQWVVADIIPHPQIPVPGACGLREGVRVFCGFY
jgi:hypothetical protein